MKKFVGAVATAAALACATPTSAAMMLTTITGDWNSHPEWVNWSVELKYETNGLQANSTNTLFTWSSALGTPSPLLYAKGWAKGNTYCDYWQIEEGCVSEPLLIEFEKTAFTSFSIDVSDSRYLISFEGPDIDFSGLGHDWGTFNNVQIDKPFYHNDYGSYGYGVADGKSLGGIHTHGLNVTAAPVPEPATWAMMIIGFGLAGGGIRHTRKRAVIAA